MIEMKSIYRKTGMVVAVLALLVVMSAPTAMAKDSDLPTIDVYWDSDRDVIVTIASDFGNQGDKVHQCRYYQPGTGEPANDGDESLPSEGPYSDVNLDGYFATGCFVPDVNGDPYTDEFNMVDFGVQDTYGVWTVWLLKGGNAEKSDATSPRGHVTVGCVPIPEFTTIAIPVVALLGLVAFYRRKQKK